jgi:integrase
VRGYDELPDLRKVHFVDHLKPLVILSLNTGCRRGELFNLHRSDVNLDMELLTVSGGKTNRSRHISLNSIATNTLRLWFEQHPTMGPNDYVFESPKGGRLNNVKRAWQTLLGDAGIAGFRWHDMRHSFASRLVMAGVDLNTVRELLGHTDISMTLRYSHLSPEIKRRAVENLVVAEGRTVKFRGKRKA